MMAVAALETHPEQLRIRKLLYFACFQQWESDPSRLEQESLISLLDQLQRQTRTLEKLQRYLNAIATSLNKPDTYGAIADLIIQTIQAEPQTQPISSPPPLSPRPHPVQLSDPLDAEPNGFELRHALMQAGNPYKLKLILAALLCVNHSSKTVGLHLQTYSLDEMVPLAIAQYPSPQFLGPTLITLPVEHFLGLPPIQILWTAYPSQPAPPAMAFATFLEPPDLELDGDLTQLICPT
jgi:hypothetical protein